MRQMTKNKRTISFYTGQSSLESAFAYHDTMLIERSVQNDTTLPMANKDAKNTELQLKELPLEFGGRGEVKGFVFRQVAINDWGYIYEVKQSGVPAYFEVFKRMENNRFCCIAYPGSKSFGIWAWTTGDRASGLQRFESFFKSNA